MIKKVMFYFRRKKIAVLQEGAQEFLLALAGLAGTASGSCQTAHGGRGGRWMMGWGTGQIST